jgi:hypothetical protein
VDEGEGEGEACEGSGWTWAAEGGVDEGGALLVLGLEVGAEFVWMEEVDGYWRRAVEAAVRATLEDEEPILVVAVPDYGEAMLRSQSPESVIS